MTLSSSAPGRAALTITSIITLLFPSIARAQQAVTPAAGEPPPIEARTQEQATITNQAQQAYAQAHQDELRREAARQVAEERRAAWDQRGRENIPPAIIAHLPALTLSLPGRFGALFSQGTVLQVGGTAELELRVQKYWGLAVGGGLMSFRNTGDVYVPNARFGAVITEASGFLALPGNSKRYTEATHGMLRLGHQLLFPIGQPTLPTAYLGLFAGIGAQIAVAPIDGDKGYVSMTFETRIGYRFKLGSGEDSAIGGGFIDILAGPTVGF